MAVNSRFERAENVHAFRLAEINWRMRELVLDDPDSGGSDKIVRERGRIALRDYLAQSLVDTTICNQAALEMTVAASEADVPDLFRLYATYSIISKARSTNRRFPIPPLIVDYALDLAASVDEHDIAFRLSVPAITVPPRPR